MYGQCLVTPTILDSYEFAVNAPHSWKVKAETGFLAKLRREKVDYPAWVKKGLDFENTVYKVCNVHRNKEITVGSEHFQSVCNAVNGGQFQIKLSKKVEIAGQQVFLFGYADAVQPTKVQDLKTTLKYKGPEKYLSGHQHLMYTSLTNLEHFEYIVVQWESESTNKIAAVHTIPFWVDDFNEHNAVLYTKIEAFFNYLRENNLWQDYYTIFSKN